MRCKEATCQKAIKHVGRGRKPDYCSAACRQKDYRRRQKAQHAALPGLGPAQDLSEGLDHMKSYVQGLAQLDVLDKAAVMKLTVIHMLETLDESEFSTFLERVHDQIYLEATQREIKVCSIS